MGQVLKAQSYLNSFILWNYRMFIACLVLAFIMLFIFGLSTIPISIFVANIFLFLSLYQGVQWKKKCDLSKENDIRQIMTELRKKRTIELLLLCCGIVIGTLSIYFPLNMSIGAVSLSGVSSILLFLTLKFEWELGLLVEKL